MTEIPLKNRVIQAKRATPWRIYRRQGGTDAGVVKITGNTRSTKALIKGGMGRRMRSKDSN